MTVCASEIVVGKAAPVVRAGCVISADGAYAARLTRASGAVRGWYPERWTLDGPEPYAVPLPGDRPEEPASQVLPLSDGRVLIARHRRRGRYELALLYPTGPDTGQVALGSLDLAALGATRLSLLPPSPGGQLAYALACGPRTSTVWLVAGGTAAGPQRVATVRGRCSGGAWLDQEGRLLSLDRTAPGVGGAPAPVKSVVVDLLRGGEVTPLLQITEHSDDRLLLASPASGLLLVRSDAAGTDRLGWGVLGSHRPVRFPEALCPAGVRLTPFALQPGQMLQPENCSVALRADGPNGTWVAVWRPGRKALAHLPAPEGWLAGTGLWTPGGELRLPYATAQTACGVATLRAFRPAVRQAPMAEAADDAEPPDAMPLREGPPPGAARGGRAPTSAPVLPLRHAPMARGA
ncbi:hypothetical protein LHJ74_09635 [Streptomyces sp. N2-109]|uniref:Uncharacterized protein n=1 Tax=Streptomyces gossypii TaxID=2883101 RepID=A0ABT2JS36_9ACTN|nr:hypothetical protein [Streptomyces gossypii]MCT2590170.1 hypothetical protein [Streptomyces gossypii]